MKRLALVGFAFGLAFAADTTLKLTVDGKASGNAIVVAGKTYLPLDALEKAGLKVVRSNGALAVTVSGTTQPGAQASSGQVSNQASGGANGKASLEGCIGEQLFNGVWRIKVTKLERITKDEGASLGWGLSLELRNGTKSTITPNGTGIENSDIVLAFDDASTLALTPFEAQKLTYANVPTGTAVVLKLPYFYEIGINESDIKTPIKFLFQIDPSKIDKNTRESGVAYSVPNPSFRVRLDCQK
jgi:hypothetical protein